MTTTDDRIIELQQEIAERGTPLEDSEALHVIAEALTEISHQLTVANEHRESMIELWSTVIARGPGEVRVRSYP